MLLIHRRVLKTAIASTAFKLGARPQAAVAHNSPPLLTYITTSPDDTHCASPVGPSKMKFKLFKSKSKGTSEDTARSNGLPNVPYYLGPSGIDSTKKLSPPILEKIFAYVCPHAQDDTYESCEQSAVEDACMLCDLRDLSHCARTCRRWRKLATNVL